MTTLLIDGNAFAYMIDINSTKNAKDFARLFLNKIRDYAKEFNLMSKCVIFFDDKKGGTWRDELYPDYQKNRKAQREKYTDRQRKESQLRSEYLNYIKKQIDNSKYSYLSYPNTETDDLVSLYCNYIQDENEETIILTTDKDLVQLVNEDKNIKVMLISKHELYRKDEDSKKALETKIMLGDTSDSIPSVCKGVGPKYYPDFKIFLKTMKNEDVNPQDQEKSKKVCEKFNIKYIKSFSNFNVEQLRLNKKLIDLRYVCELDKQNNYEKTNYIKDNIKTAKVSPYSLYNIKLD